MFTWFASSSAGMIDWTLLIFFSLKSTNASWYSTLAPVLEKNNENGVFRYETPNNLKQGECLKNSLIKSINDSSTNGWFSSFYSSSFRPCLAGNLPFKVRFIEEGIELNCIFTIAIIVLLTNWSGVVPNQMHESNLHGYCVQKLTVHCRSL